MTIGQRIDLIRHQKGMSVQQLANKAKISKYTIYSWTYRDIHPDIKTLCRIADVLNCTLDELAGRNESRARGKWIVKGHHLLNDKKIVCSCCGYSENKGTIWNISFGVHKFCPDCGAKMGE